MFILLLNTLKTVFTKPREVVDPFLLNKKPEFAHPALFCLIAVVLVTLLFSLFVDFKIEPVIASELSESDQRLQDAAATMERAAVRVATQFLPVAMMFLLIPFLALGGYFFFRERMDGYYANLILNTYAVGASLFVLLLLIPIWNLVPFPFTDSTMNSTVPGLLTGISVIWIYRQYFQASGFMIWLKMISAFTLGYVIFSLLTNFIGGTIGFFIFWVGEVLEAL